MIFIYNLTHFSYLIFEYFSIAMLWLEHAIQRDVMSKDREREFVFLWLDRVPRFSLCVLSRCAIPPRQSRSLPTEGSPCDSFF